MATIIVNDNLPASHSQNARRSQRVYADVQVVNEGNADGFAELVLMGDLNGTSGVQEVRRGGGGALLKAYSNYIGGGGPYRVTAIVFEIVNGQRVSPFLARHDNFTANIVVQRGGSWMSQEEADALAAAEAAAAAAARARIEAAERARIERQNREQEERERQRREAEERRRRERFQTEEDDWVAPPQPQPDPEPDYDEGGYFFESAPAPVVLDPVVEIVVAAPWQTEESDYVEPEPEPFVEPDWWRWEE